VADSDITAQVVDYSKAYPENPRSKHCRDTYAELKTGFYFGQWKKDPHFGLSSYTRAKEFASILKGWIKDWEIPSDTSHRDSAFC